MGSNSQSGSWIHDSSFMSLSVGGCSQGEQDMRDSMFMFKTQPWVDSNTAAKKALQNVTMGSVVGDLAFQKTSKGMKRKRSKGHVALEEESELVLGLGCAANFSDSGGNSGTRMSSGSMFMTEAEEDSPMDLGLGLASSLSGSSHEPILDCVTPATGLMTFGDFSAVTSLDSERNMYSPGNQNHLMGSNVFLGLGPLQSGVKDLDVRKGFCVSSPASEENTCGTQLQLGLSRNSAVVTDSDCFSGVSLGLGPSGDMHETRSDIVVGIENIPVVDEGSTSARWMKSGGYIPSLLMGRRLDVTDFTSTSAFDSMNKETCPRATTKTFVQEETAELSPLATLRASDWTISTNEASGGLPDRAFKTCKFVGCGKGARGASGLCIAHGGGRRCQKEACNKGAEGRTVYCKAHGGGRRCQSLGCTRSAEGKTDYCISHGGGRRCSHDGCTKAARGKSGLCIRHGGGKRCQKEGCTKSAEGYSGLCISHGGGRRCQFPGCGKGAQGSTMFCKAHGGGKRCMIQGCNKGAEGSTPLCKGHGGGKRCMFDGEGICNKSVHGGTQFCVAHGGGKRCAVQDCTKSARGRTDYCVRHGGGKRCKFEGCVKSAQGSTDFCKAHGGGRRCSWGQEGSPYNEEYLKEKTVELFKGPCDRFARGKTGLCAAHGAFVQDRRIHGGGILGPAPGIGPGLFQGLVSVSTEIGQSSADTNKQVIDSGFIIANDQSLCMGGTEDQQYSRASHGAWSDWRGGASAEKELPFSAVFRTEKAAGKSHTLQKSNGNQLDVGTQNDSTSPLDRMNLNLLSSLEPSGYWCAVSNSLAQSVATSSSHIMDTATQRESSPMFTCSQLSNHGPVARVPATGTWLSLTRPLIPPNVLVPPSMQKGDCGAPHGKAHTEVCNVPTSDEGVFDMSALSLTEERVHGGKLMALIAREASESGGLVQRNSRLAVGALSFVSDPINKGGYEQYILDMDAIGMRRSCTLGDVSQFLATGVDMN